MTNDDWTPYHLPRRHGETILERMERRSEAHVDQVAPPRKADRKPSLVVHVWPDVIGTRNEGDALPPRRRDYVLPIGSSVTVLHGTCHIERPDGSTLQVANVSRVEVATSV